MESNGFMTVQEIEEQTAELRSIADELLALNHPQSPEIQRKRDYLDKITKAFVHRVDRQNDVIRMSTRFHKLIDEVRLIVVTGERI